MKIGMVGLGRMGGEMVRRLMAGGHQCVVFDRDAEAVQALTGEGAIGAGDYADFAAKLDSPKVVWMMVPAGVVDTLIADLRPHLESGDILIDGGNSRYTLDIARSQALRDAEVRYLDCGTSGGVWGRERGYCLMIGGEDAAVQYLNPIFATLAPGKGDIAPTPGQPLDGSTADRGYLHCGPSGAGHFVKMVHNAIEYGMMAAYAEGFNILTQADAGVQSLQHDAETTPLDHPEWYQYQFNLANIAEVWRRGSVISSWLLDLSAIALTESPKLQEFSGVVSDSGEGRWTLQAAIDEAVPADVLSSALYQRFSSRDESLFADKLLSALRYQFGGHHEKTADETGGGVAIG